jgi:hypothetical protein
VSSRSTEEALQKAACLLKAYDAKKEVPKGAEETRHQEQDCQKGQREQREAGAPSVGGGAHAVLAEPLLTPEGALLRGDMSGEPTFTKHSLILSVR